MTSIKWRSYEIINRAVEEGIAYGYNQAKEDIDDAGDNFSEETKTQIIFDKLENAVMNALSEVIDFDDDSVRVEEEGG